MALVDAARRVHAFLTDPKLGTWPYIEGVEFCGDLEAQAKDLSEAIASDAAETLKLRAALATALDLLRSGRFDGRCSDTNDCPLCAWDSNRDLLIDQWGHLNP